MQFVLLANIGWLERCDDEVTQANLAAQAETDPMMTSQVVRTLEKHGFVRRIQNPTDHRKILLSLSPSGVKLLAKSIAVVEAVDHAFFEKLGKSLRAFCADLKKLKDTE